ncbi:hypothetical protein P692DRAFT_20836113 [Suillus brevipes Sb2]|nr:hypothetical protein P692DRAFT_20836113 [Suillus brevipes Sb2]
MTGPSRKKNKGKGNGEKKTPSGLSSQSMDVDPISCSTLEEDEMTRCNQPAEEGFERCEVHQAQYRTMYKKYKEASEVVDNIISGRELPTKEQIQRYIDLHFTLDKARWVREYLESIRVERTGREIHQKRFFLKVDDGQKIRLKVLAKKMIEAVDTLNDLQARALDLYMANNPDCKWMKPIQSPNNFDDEPISTEESVGAAQRTLPNDRKNSTGTLSASEKFTTSSALADEDLIDLEHRAQKAQLLRVFSIFTDPDFFARLRDEADPDNSDPAFEPDPSVLYNISQQYARRIMYYDSDFFFKTLNKVSFRDLVLSDDFSIEDTFKFMSLFENNKLGLGLMWLKDAVLDALEMAKERGNVAQFGRLSSRHNVLGGWIYSCAHTRQISKEAWWYLLEILKPPTDVENRFVRLCNNFDDMVNFLSLGAIGMLSPPTFCSKQYDGVDAILPRKHLSLSGVVIADMVSSPMPPRMIGPILTTRRARKPGCIVWCEMETRGYMFGALRNEPDSFNDAFVRELRARPDLFQVVTRSETDPGRDVEIFPTNALPVSRYRQFEAPSALTANRPTGSGEWSVTRSAVDVLYGTHCEMPGGSNHPFPGYLQNRNQLGWFFRFIKFPVKYIVILDTVPNRHHSILAMNVAWAALRAQGYGEGEFESRKYARASDNLFQKRAEELFSWTPKNWRWEATKLVYVDDVDEGGNADRPEADYPELVSKITTTKAMGSEGEGTGEGDESESEGQAEDDECDSESEGAEGDDQGEYKDKGKGEKEKGWGCIVS